MLANCLRCMDCTRRPACSPPWKSGLPSRSRARGWAPQPYACVVPLWTRLRPLRRCAHHQQLDEPELHMLWKQCCQGRTSGCSSALNYYGDVFNDTGPVDMACIRSGSRNDGGAAVRPRRDGPHQRVRLHHAPAHGGIGSGGAGAVSGLPRAVRRPCGKRGKHK